MRKEENILYITQLKKPTVMKEAYLKEFKYKPQKYLLLLISNRLVKSSLKVGNKATHLISLQIVE
jgi:hypothetical protein